MAVLAGTARPSAQPWEPFHPLAVEFLTALSAAVRQGCARREELAAFGFWCRRARLERLRERHKSPRPRLGRGLIFHAAPSNVPAMFAYTYAIGLLAGNANIVRLSTRRGEGEELLCRWVGEVLDRPEFAAVKARSSFVSYPRDDGRTAALLSRCAGRVVWGGDATVAAMRRIPMPPWAVDLAFPDRWSLALLSQAYVAGLGEEELGDLARRFYNDAYVMDQNACSSPQLAVWLADGGEAGARRRWWEAVAREAEGRYCLEAFQAARKFERFCRRAMAGPGVEGLERYGGNLVWTARLSGPPGENLPPRGGFGLFWEREIGTLDQLPALLDDRAQTVVCVGVDPAETAAFLAARGARGVTRVVPAGQALEMDTVWDGRDLIAELSRVIG